jgi:hypothetical protein
MRSGKMADEVLATFTIRTEDEAEGMKERHVSVGLATLVADVRGRGGILGQSRPAPPVTMYVPRRTKRKE